MINKKNFKTQLIIRIIILFIFMLFLVIGIAKDINIYSLILFVLFIGLQVKGLFQFINHTNIELQSFLEGLKFGDYQQAYSISHLGPSFEALEKTLQATVEKFKNMRSEKELQATYYQSLAQHIPIPFFIVYADNTIEIINNVTRRTFNVANITHTRDLADFGAIFQRDVVQVKPGEALLSTVELSGINEYFIITATQLISGGKTRKLVSLQNVQSNLDATELATWQNLLKVTSHEILNSLAPVSSCAQMAKTMVNDIVDQKSLTGELREEMNDVYQTLDTLLRRSEGLTRFIQSYRQLSRLPQPKKVKIEITDYFNHLQSLVQSELRRKKIELVFHYYPKGLFVLADEDMLDQVLINLIRNATDALCNIENAMIKITAYIDNKQRKVIEVEDNGSGVPDEQIEKIFLPFYSTKPEGSGIGLSLTRYIMLSHGGSVVYHQCDNGGAKFSLVF